MTRESGRDTDNHARQLARLDQQKRELECQKLRSEIAHISLEWWKPPTYIGSVVTLIALLTGWLGGYFPAERERLKEEIAKLQTEKRDRLQESLLLNSDLERLKEERAEWRSRVHELTRQKNKLNVDLARLKEKVEGLQQRIDDAYIRLNIARFNAEFALSHIHDPSARTGMLTEMESALKQLPLEGTVARDDLLGNVRLISHMVEATEEELNELRKSLAKIHASEWAVKLKPQPVGLFAPERCLLCAPDYRVYDPLTKRYEDVKEFPGGQEAWEKYCK